MRERGRRRWRPRRRGFSYRLPAVQACFDAFYRAEDLLTVRLCLEELAQTVVAQHKTQQGKKMEMGTQIGGNQRKEDLHRFAVKTAEFNRLIKKTKGNDRPGNVQ